MKEKKLKYFIMRYLFFISVYILIVFFSTLGYGQNPTNKFSEEAEKLYNAEKYEETIVFCDEKISELLKQTKIDSLSIADLYSYLGSTQYKTRQYEQSIENQEIGITYCPKNEKGKYIKGKLFYWKSFPEYFLNQPYKSYYSKKHALEAIGSMKNPDLEYLTGIYGELALDASFMGFYDTAMQFLERAIQVNRRKHEEELKNKKYISRKDLRLWLLYRYAQIINDKSSFEYSNEDLKRFRVLVKNVNKLKKDPYLVWGAKNDIMTGAIYNFYGDVFLSIEPKPSKKQIDSAFYYFNKASKYLKKENNIYHYSLLKYNISKAQKLTRKYEKALEIIEELMVLESTKDANHLSSYISEKIDLLLLLNQTKEARQLIYNAINTVHNSLEVLKEDYSNFEPSNSISQVGDIISIAESFENLKRRAPQLLNYQDIFYQLSLKQLKSSYKSTQFNIKLK